MDVASTAGEVVRRKRWRLRLPEGLPNLKGAWLTAYTIIWAILLPLALISAVASSFVVLTTPTIWSPYGFSTEPDSRGAVVTLVSSPAVRANGVRPGDHVVSVDGWAVPQNSSGRDAARLRVIKPNGSFTSFAFRRPGGEVYTLRLLRSTKFEEEAYRAAGTSRLLGRIVHEITVVPVPILLLSAAVLLFFRRRRDAVPALLSLSFLLTGATWNHPEMLGINFVLADNVGTVGFCLLLAALFAFPAGEFQPRWTAVPFLLLPSFVFLDLFFPDSRQFGFLLGGGFFVLVLTALILRYRKLEAGAQRQQLRWAFFGLVVGIAMAVVGIAFAVASSAWQARDPRWSVWGDLTAPIFLTASFCAMALGIIVSILRYRLYDADVTIGRSAAYGVLTLGFVALFAASEKIIELLSQEYLGQNIGGLAGGVAAALAAVAIAPMHDRTRRWAERRFQKGLYRLRHALPPLVGDLRETAGVEQIAGATLDSLVEGARASRAALIAREELVDAREIPAGEVKAWYDRWTRPSHDGFDVDRSDPTFPVRMPLEAEGHGRVGWLLLGPRPDGSLFGKAECDAIEEIAEPVARALEVTLRRQERELHIESRLQAIEAAIAKLAKAPARTTVGARLKEGRV
jgi:hypothetical protein